jgi:hypothetical protein
LIEIKKKVLKTGIGINTQINLNVNGIQYSYTLILDSLKDKNGKIIGITGVTWDNSDQKT